MWQRHNSISNVIINIQDSWICKKSNDKVFSILLPVASAFSVLRLNVFLLLRDACTTCIHAAATYPVTHTLNLTQTRGKQLCSPVPYWLTAFKRLLCICEVEMWPTRIVLSGLDCGVRKVCSQKWAITIPDSDKNGPKKLCKALTTDF